MNIKVAVFTVSEKSSNIFGSNFTPLFIFTVSVTGMQNGDKAFPSIILAGQVF